MSSVPLPQLATLGEMLKYLRRRARLTQRELSIAVGYSEGQISRLENNERIADAATLQALFVPALDIEDQPEVIEQLLALAADARATVDGDVIVPATVSDARNVSKPPLTNLPTRLTSFIGREAAIASLHQLIPSNRLVTLTGVGGVGKTSLALVVGSRLTSAFGDGVWWIELASLAKADLVPQLIATLFKLSEPDDHTYLESLTSYLQDRHLLLILDNCEHLIDSCATVVDTLLRGCPQLHILTTSRESLRVEGEVERYVSPLAAPPLESELDILSTEQETQSYEAVHLFVERARGAQPTLTLSAQNTKSVVLICRQLDGIPLAIELAASRLKGLTVDELAARLHDRFRLLTGGTRTALPRHQTLRATLDWSHNLLAEDERILFRRLAIFSGGWTLDAVEAIAKGQTDELVPIPNAVELLLQLVNQSLVVAETRGRETRYRLLETIREYAMEKLREVGEVNAVCARHFAYYLALAEQSRDSTLTGRRLAAWGAQIAVEMDNLRRAASWADKQQDNGEQSLRLAGALWLFWYIFGGQRDGQAWLDNALSRGTAQSPQTRATALYGLAYLLFLSATPTHRATLVEEALPLAQQASDDLGIAHCYSLLGGIVFQQGDYPRALEYHQRALDLYQALNCMLFVSTCIYGIGDARLQLGQVDQAILMLEQGFANRVRDEDYLFQGGLPCQVFVRLFYANEREGRRLFEKELARQRALGTPETLAPLIHAYSRQLALSNAPQDIERSFSMLQEALVLWQQLGIRWSIAGGTARAYMDLGHLYTFRGEFSLAIEYEQEASRLYNEAGDLHGVAWAQMSIGWPALAQGDFMLAEESFRHSLQLTPDGSMSSVPYALIGLAEIMRQQGKLTRASQLFGAAARFNEQDVAEYLPHKRLSLVHAARVDLDSPDFAAAWAAGEAMTIEQAIAFALE